MNTVHIGTMGWGYEFWEGKLYPKGLAPKEFLTVYSRHFETVEVDSTFYGIPHREVIEKWRDQTPANFLFSLKFPQIVTQKKMLRNCEDEARRFIERVLLPQGKLGPLLLQFPYEFKPESFHLLSDFLPTLPKGHRFAVEVRNKKLLEGKFYSLLRGNNVALALVDHPYLPKVEELTTDFTYIRLEGDRKKVKGTLGQVEIDRTREILEWAEKMKRFLASSVEVFGYFSKYYSGYLPDDAMQLLAPLN